MKTDGTLCNLFDESRNKTYRHEENGVSPVCPRISRISVPRISSAISPIGL